LEAKGGAGFRGRAAGDEAQAAVGSVSCAATYSGGLQVSGWCSADSACCCEAADADGFARQSAFGGQLDLQGAVALWFRSAASLWWLARNGKGCRSFALSSLRTGTIPVGGAAGCSAYTLGSRLTRRRFSSSEFISGKKSPRR
jgi:hypothetical protein